MDTLDKLALAYVVVFLVNLAPAFMPPTWSILAFFLISYELPLAPVAIGGALAASAGRLTLASASRRWGRRWLAPQRQEHLAELGAWLDRRARWSAPVAMLFYSFGPIPSNQLFIGAGLTGIRLWPIVGAFLLGRLLSYSFFVASARAAASRIEELFSRHWSDPIALAAQVLAIAALVIVTRIDWPRLLNVSPPQDGRRSRSASTRRFPE